MWCSSLLLAGSLSLSTGDGAHGLCQTLETCGHQPGLLLLQTQAALFKGRGAGHAVQQDANMQFPASPSSAEDAAVADLKGNLDGIAEMLRQRGRLATPPATAGSYPPAGHVTKASDDSAVADVRRELQALHERFHAGGHPHHREFHQPFGSSLLRSVHEDLHSIRHSVHEPEPPAVEIHIDGTDLQQAMGSGAAPSKETALQSQLQDLVEQLKSNAGATAPVAGSAESASTSAAAVDVAAAAAATATTAVPAGATPAASSGLPVDAAGPATDGTTAAPATDVAAASATTAAPAIDGTTAAAATDVTAAPGTTAAPAIDGTTAAPTTAATAAPSTAATAISTTSEPVTTTPVPGTALPGATPPPSTTANASIGTPTSTTQALGGNITNSTDDANATAAPAAVAEAANASAAAAVVTVAAAVLNSSVDTGKEISSLKDDLTSLHGDLHKILQQIHNAPKAAAGIDGVPLTPTISPIGAQSSTTSAPATASTTFQTPEVLTTTAGAQTTTNSTQTVFSKGFGNSTLPNFSLPVDLATGNITGNISSAIAAADAAVDVVSNITSVSADQAEEVDGLKDQITHMHEDVAHIMRDLSAPAIAGDVLPGAADGLPVAGPPLAGPPVAGPPVAGPVAQSPPSVGSLQPTLAPLPPAPAQLPPTPTLQPVSNPEAAAPSQEQAWGTVHEALEHYHDGPQGASADGDVAGPAAWPASGTSAEGDVAGPAAWPASGTSDAASVSSSASGVADVELFACADCTKHGFAVDACACGVCGSFGQCTFSCENHHDMAAPGAHTWPCVKDAVVEDASTAETTADIANIRDDVVNIGTNMAAEMGHMHSDMHHILQHLEDERAPAVAGPVNAAAGRMETPAVEGYLPSPMAPPGGAGADASGQLVDQGALGAGAEGSGQFSDQGPLAAGADGSGQFSDQGPLGAVTSAPTTLPSVDSVIGCCFSMEKDLDEAPCCLRTWRSVRESCSWEYLPTEAESATALGWKREGCPSSLDEAKTSIEHTALEAAAQAEELAREGKSTTWWPGESFAEG